MKWRAPEYRLMMLTRTGNVLIKVTGSRSYLWRMADKALSSRGRQWIELNTAPAFVLKR